MKRIILLVFSICAGALCAQDSGGEMPASADTIPAQLPINYGNRIQKGTVLLTGGLAYSNSEDFLRKVDDFSINGSALFAVSNRFALGPLFGFGTTKSIFNNEFFGEGTEYHFNYYSLGAQFRYFGNTYWGWLQPYGELFVGYQSGKNLETDANSFESFGVGLRPGLMIFLSRQIALDFSIGFLSYSNLSFPVGDDITSFGFGFEPRDLSFGLVFLFNAQ